MVKDRRLLEYKRKIILDDTTDKEVDSPLSSHKTNLSQD